MDNYQIADALSLLAKLTDIHGENSFKAKSYSSAAFAIEKLTVQLHEMPKEKISVLNGIGVSTAQKIIEYIETGKINALEDIISKTPKGIIEMISIKGIGPKKINTIWKEMEIETIGELLYACKENRLKLFKGFGEKTQQNVIDAIEFYNKNRGSYLYAQVENIINEFNEFLSLYLKNIKFEVTGQFKRQLEIIDKIEYLIQAEPEKIVEWLSVAPGFTVISTNNTQIIYATPAGIDLCLYPVDESEIIKKSISITSSTSFWGELANCESTNNVIEKSEQDFFENRALPYFPCFLRENESLIQEFKNKLLPDVIETSDIKGIIHSHSNWSDGSNTIEEMAEACIKLGMEYLVISDHSKSAFYAQGLSVEKIYAQHKYIDELNKKLHPFTIFKSIESDILNDGNLDYDDHTLKQFDLVIASVHSNLKMNEEKAMMRLIKAIENPYTRILGHMTGRLLLSRPGYPVDHQKIIDACAANDVVIELNAHPSRLDIDWRQIEYARNKNVLISINPDAHTLEGLKDIKYGVAVAQKSMITKAQNLSSYNLMDISSWIQKKRS